MGVIKSILLVFVSILLFTSFFVSIFCITISSSLTYNNVQNQSLSLVHDVLQDKFNITSIISENYAFYEYYCKDYESYTFALENYTFNISCSVALNGKQAVIDEGINQFIHQVYYNDYGCHFSQCFKQQKIPLFLISKLSHDFFLKFFLLSVLILLVLLALGFLLIEKKTSLPILAGSVLILASLPFLKIGNLLTFFPDKLYVQLLKIFFSQSRTIAIIFLILSGILIIIGVILKIFKIGLSATKFVSKIKKDKTKDTK
jgi:hypothetical protein